MSNYKTFHIHGALSATLRWQESYPGEPRPATIILKEYVSATIDGNTYIVGTVSTGMSGENKGDRQPYRDNYVKYATYERYQIIQNPGAEITLNANPDVQGTTSGTYLAPDGITRYQHYCRGSAYYAVAALSAPTISLSGGNAPASTEDARTYLIGQRLTGTVSPIGFAGVNPSAQGTIPAYQWSVSSGQPFKEFKVTYKVNDGLRQYASTGKRIATDFQASSLVCSFAKPTPPSTVACQVHYALPQYALPTDGLI